MTVTPKEWKAFDHIPVNGKKLRASVQKIYGQTRDMPICTEPNNILIVNPECSNHLAPPYCLARFDHIVSTECSRHAKSKYQAFLLSGPKHTGDPNKDKNRASSTPALHLGTWIGQGGVKPCISWESREQEPGVINAMDDFLGVIKTYITPKIVAHMKEFFPVQYRRSLA